MKKIIYSILFSTCYLTLVTAANAEILERIVAIVNEDIILYSEYQNALQSAIESDSRISPDKLLNNIIDNMLLINEAEKFRTSKPDKNNKIESDNSAVVGEYIDRRIRALIHVPYDGIENYYQKNIDLYEDKAIIDVRDAIEEQLVEAELKIKLKEHLEELRKKAYIRIQLNEKD